MIQVVQFNFRSSTIHSRFDSLSMYVHKLETKKYIVNECKKINYFKRVRFEVLLVVWQKIQVFRDVTPCH
jgi:hypothetical protein